MPRSARIAPYSLLTDVLPVPGGPVMGMKLSVSGNDPIHSLANEASIEIELNRFFFSHFTVVVRFHYIEEAPH
jgi:hypothetical protein